MEVGAHWMEQGFSEDCLLLPLIGTPHWSRRVLCVGHVLPHLGFTAFRAEPMVFNVLT